MNNLEARKLANEFVKCWGDTLANASLFGSTTRGEENPNDIDILIIKKDGTNIPI